MFEVEEDTGEGWEMIPSIPSRPVIPRISETASRTFTSDSNLKCTCFMIVKGNALRNIEVDNEMVEVDGVASIIREGDFNMEIAYAMQEPSVSESIADTRIVEAWRELL